jgi:hypothetical protein
MDEKRFWDIIACCCPPGASKRDWLRALVAQVARLPPDDIIGFEVRMWRLVNAAYHNDLWRAAALIQGMCSDDAFTYFRCWLVAQGKAVYEAALADPDSLANVVRVQAWYTFEPMLSVAGMAWAETGTHEQEFNDATREAGLGFGELQGEEWDFADRDEVRRRFPRLARRFLDREGGA